MIEFVLFSIVGIVIDVVLVYVGNGIYQENKERANRDHQYWWEN